MIFKILYNIQSKKFNIPSDMAFRDMNENFILQDEHHTTQRFDKLKIN